MKYFVIFGSDWDLYKQSFSDIFDKDNVSYICEPPKSMPFRDKILYGIQHNKHLYRRYILPISNHWFPYYIKDICENIPQEGENVIFIFQRKWLVDEYYGFVTYLKNKFPKAKFVLFLCDLFCTIQSNKGGQKMTIDEIQTMFDLIVSFDQNDCKQYGFIYHPLVFSSYHGEIKNMHDSDVYFLGKVKNRFKDIIGCFERLYENDVKADFWLVGVDKNEQVYKDLIHYPISMSYQDNLQHVLHCNCELEIMQAGGFGYTQRMCEVIAFDKKLITNNPTVHEAPFYNSDYIFQIEKPTDITKEMCEKIKKRDIVDYHYKEKLSPIELLEFIEKKLTK